MKALRESIIVPTVTYASEICTWNKCQRSKIEAVEMRCGCVMNKINGEINENVYGRFGSSSRGNDELQNGKSGEIQHTEMVWTFRKNG